MPRLYQLRKDQGRQDKGQQHGPGLGGNQHVAARKAIDQDAGAEREKQHRNGRGKADQSKIERRARQLIGQPTLSDVLHPGADERDELPAEVKAVVAMTQRGEGARERRRALLNGCR